MDISVVELARTGKSVWVFEMQGLTNRGNAV
jgi:hypothetical protein